MVNYQNGKIYLIVSKSNKLLYVGSTAQQYISTRIQKHLNTKQLGKQTCSSCKVLDCDDYYYTLLKDYPCNNKQQLVKEEGYWIIHYKEHSEGYTCVNDRIAGRTWKEWYEANREHLSAKQKEYREANKEQIAERNKDYYEKNKDELSAKNKEYRDNHKEQITEKAKEYYEVNKEQILAQKKENYEANKEQILAQKKEHYEANKSKYQEKHNCPCGGKYTTENKTKHEGSNRHQEYLKSQNK